MKKHNEKYTSIGERLINPNEVKPRSLKDEIRRIQSVFDLNPRYRQVVTLP